jgi:hypothetical protein
MSPRAIHQITRDDILAPEAYAAERAERRREINEIKRFRRLEVGPYATFYFENFDTMLHQVHEMLHIEKGGDAQIVDELAAYNPLVPTGRELVATLMFEIADPERRDRELRRLTFVEKTITLDSVSPAPGWSLASATKIMVTWRRCRNRCARPWPTILISEVPLGSVWRVHRSRLQPRCRVIHDKGKLGVLSISRRSRP